MIRASIGLVTWSGGISVPLPTMTARGMGTPDRGAGPRPARPEAGILPAPPAKLAAEVAPGTRGRYGRLVLAPGAEAPDFAIEGETLHALLARGPAVVFFFPKAFTPG
jgi:hypothetical protein